MFTKIIQAVTVAAVVLSIAACNPQNPDQTATSLITAWGGSYYEQGSIWGQISNNPGMDIDTSRPAVQRQIKIYQAQPDYLIHIVEQSRPFIYYVYDQTQKQGLPAILALLPYVESDYNPKGRDRSGADGLWQLMPRTAKGLGVKKTSSYNGNHDVVVSTTAAFKYLHHLYQYYDNNWLLALAAYNAGSGKVDAAIRYNKAHGLPTDYWHLQTLPRETRKYIPKLIALAAIVRYSRYYHIQLPNIPDQPYVESIKPTKALNLSCVAKLAGISENTLRKLNPAFKHTAANTKGSYTLLIPTEKIAQLREGLAMLTSKKLKTEANFNKTDTQNGLNLDSTNPARQRHKITKNNKESHTHLLVEDSHKINNLAAAEVAENDG